VERRFGGSLSGYGVLDTAILETSNGGLAEVKVDMLDTAIPETSNGGI
jgi:hypothetical protein